MNILIINHYAGSRALGSETRPWRLALEFRRAGHRTLIAAADFSHKRARNPAIRPPRQETSVDGVEFCFYATPSSENDVGGREGNIAAFARGLWRDAPRLAEEFRPQAVVAASTHPYDFFGAARVARRAGAPLVLELREIWPEYQRELYHCDRKDASFFLGEWALDRALRRADAVVSLLPHGERYLTARGIPAGKYLEIPEAAGPPGRGSLSERRRDYLERLRRSYDFLLVYQGYIGEEKCLRPLVEAAKLLEGENAAVLMVGNGGYKVSIKRAMREAGARNVYLMDRVEESEKGALCAIADCLFYGDRRRSAGVYGVRSSKLLEYMSWGRPVLTALAAGESPVTLAGCGFNVPDPSPEALAAGIRRMAALTPGEREEMGRRGAAYLAEHHSYPRAAERYLELFRRLGEEKEKGKG